MYHRQGNLSGSKSWQAKYDLCLLCVWLSDIECYVANKANSWLNIVISAWVPSSANKARASTAKE